MYVYVVINLCFRNHTESKAAFNDEITMKDYYVLCLWALYLLLRANVCKNRAKSKFRGHSQKITFAHILSIDRHK